MPTYFTIHVNNTQFDIISMNVHEPKLFQVWTIMDNGKKRFHLKRSDAGDLVFAMPGDCPPELLAMEREIAREVLANYGHD